MLIDEFACEADSRGWLEGYLVSERFDATLKGLDAPVRAARVHVDK